MDMEEEKEDEGGTVGDVFDATSNKANAEPRRQMVVTINKR
jgi:hypothetical protein